MPSTSAIHRKIHTSDGPLLVAGLLLDGLRVCIGFVNDLLGFKRILEGGHLALKRLILLDCDYTLLAGGVLHNHALAGSDKGAFYLALLAESTERDTFAELLRLLQAAFRDMTAARRCDPVPELLFFPDTEAASALSAAFTLPALLTLYAETERLSGQLSDTNVNLRTAAVTAAGRLWERK